MDTLIGTCSNTKPYNALIVLLWIGGIIVLKTGDGHWLANAVALAAAVIVWLTWSYLVLARPARSGERIPDKDFAPGMWDRLTVTLKLGAAVGVTAVATTVLFLATQEPAKVEAIRFVFWIPAYLSLSSASFAGIMLPFIAMRNRPRPQPVRRCLIDALDVVLSATLASATAITLFLLAHVVTGLNEELLPVAYVSLAAILVWRVGPYWRPVFRIFSQKTALN